ELTLDAAAQPQHDQECSHQAADSDYHSRSGRDAVGDVHTRRGKSASEHDRENDLDEQTAEQHTEPVNPHDVTPLADASLGRPSKYGRTSSRRSESSRKPCVPMPAQP